NSTLVIASNAAEFNTVYGFEADLSSQNVNTNGDDNYELVNGITVVDAFGVVGEDGSNTNHEYEDGRAQRKASITQANPVYTFSEWDIWNDTGDAGTINEPKDAPDAFTPGVR
ncbi:MAG TPA: hypothetical protein VJ970_04220, partial [Flavobacteriaceae bacterium]|nr:hypothetical protein [Flavobacteriaceae bacterium]